ncbi:uncharacterized protein LOC133526153 isoform X3 [Cydia pomonella]|uniref:uncharacterized protein LOC133526153 isoform X3 n=1 Tax=Cydia pomonella TaxID=82600 RepID=UPI002ADDE4DD|nr:uncharacterized protein LOC133526153 isoform X3 [Cydia pomonella]
MLKCSLIIKGLIHALVVLFAFKTANADENSVHLKDIYTIIENLVGPILKTVNIQVYEDDFNDMEAVTPNKIEKQDNTLQNGNKDKDTENEISLTDYSQEKVIDDVVKNLQDSSILKNVVTQDKIQRRFNSDTTDDEALTEDSEETIILQGQSSAEVHPNRRNIDPKPIITNITIDRSEKYKQLQHKIGSLLNKEQISNETKSLISNAFDKVINQMNSKCIFRTSEDLSSKIKFRVGKPEQAAVKSMLKIYKSQFNKLIDRYRFSSKENSKFLTNLRELFFEMHNSFKKFTMQDDLQCNAVDVGKNKSKKHSNSSKLSGLLTTVTQKSILRDQHHATACQINSICPFELKMFLADFSAKVLDTIDLVFNNYRKMYLLDVSKESSGEEKQFLQVMMDTNNLVNKKFNESFINEINKLNMDAFPEINAKVARLHKFIDASVNHVKMLVNDALTDELPRIPNKMQNTVKTDIMTTTDIELIC